MNNPDSTPKRSPAELRDDELLDFIRETVGQLNKLADRLEVYAIYHEVIDDPDIDGESGAGSTS